MVSKDIAGEKLDYSMLIDVKSSIHLEKMRHFLCLKGIGLTWHLLEALRNYKP